MANVAGIVSNSGEDFVDELSTSIVYKYTNEIFAPTLKKLNESDSLVDEALAGAISTLQFGIMNMVIISVTEYAIGKASLVAGTLFIFLKTTNAARKAKELVAGALGSIPFVGKGLGNVARATGSFIAKDRELIAKMTMDTSNNMSTVISQERRNQIMIKQSKYKKVDSTVQNAISMRGDGRNSRMGYYVHKFQTGTWKKTKLDMKHYEEVTGQQNGKEFRWSSEFVQKLNSYTDIARDAKGEVVNKSQIQLDWINAQGGKVLS